MSHTIFASPENPRQVVDTDGHLSEELFQLSVHLANGNFYPVLKSLALPEEFYTTVHMKRARYLKADDFDERIPTDIYRWDDLQKLADHAVKHKMNIYFF